jgi:DNA-binding NtrC family response regulator
MQISSGALELLRAHTWPGNVRELKNLMRYVAATAPVDDLLVEHVRDRLARRSPPEAGPSLDAPSQFRALADELRELEITRIRQALAATGGNQTAAAHLLSMPLRTFFEKAKMYGLTPKRRRRDQP